MQHAHDRKINFTDLVIEEIPIEGAFQRKRTQRRPMWIPACSQSPQKRCVLQVCVRSLPLHLKSVPQPRRHRFAKRGSPRFEGGLARPVVGSEPGSRGFSKLSLTALKSRLSLLSKLRPELWRGLDGIAALKAFKQELIQFFLCGETWPCRSTQGVRHWKPSTRLYL